MWFVLSKGVKDKIVILKRNISDAIPLPPLFHIQKEQEGIFFLQKVKYRIIIFFRYRIPKKYANVKCIQNCETESVN